MVWSFLGAAGSLVDKLDKDDEVKLLRLRMKKNELVIVPGTQRAFLSFFDDPTDKRLDPKFILVMIHDTPPV
jgi:hypothetical protein